MASPISPLQFTGQSSKIPKVRVGRIISVEVIINFADKLNVFLLIINKFFSQFSFNFCQMFYYVYLLHSSLLPPFNCQQLSDIM